jgi:hypothetical protein
MMRESRDAYGGEQSLYGSDFTYTTNIKDDDLEVAGPRTANVPLGKCAT